MQQTAYSRSAFGYARHDERRQGRPEKDTESEPGKGGHRVRQEANTLFGEVPRAPYDLREGVGHDEEGDQRMAGEQAPLGRRCPCGGVTEAHSAYPFCSVRLLT